MNSLHFELTDEGRAVHDACIRGRVPITSGDHLKATIDGCVLRYLECIGSPGECRHLVVVILNCQHDQSKAISRERGKQITNYGATSTFVYKLK